MKAPLIISLFLFGVCIFVGHQQFQLLDELRSHAKSSQSVVSLAEGASHPRSSRSRIEGKSIPAIFEQVSSLLARRSKVSKEESRRLDLEFKQTLLSLSSNELEEFFLLLEGATDLPKHDVYRMAYYALLMLQDDSPERCLDLCLRSQNWASLAGNNRTGYILKGSLQNIAKTDPMKATQWILDHETTFGDSSSPLNISDQIKYGVIKEAGKQDFHITLEITGKLRPNSLHISSRKMVGSLTLERAKELLQALRHPGVEPEVKAAATEQLALDDLSGNIEDTFSWLRRSNLSPEEMDDFMEGLARRGRTKNAPQWLEWVIGQGTKGKPLSHRQKEVIRRLFQTYVMNDFVKAGQWLNEMEDGNPRNYLVERYAYDISGVSPKVALQWAEALPDGVQREKAIRIIRRNIK